MIIRNMFADDINRKINGVVQVEQSAEEIAAQELKEYVITRELKKHFITFFNNYTEAFSEPTNDTGVWISGFFGSGKSHFLKMLSYLLENKSVMGKPSAEWFRGKFEDDPATFMLIDQATRAETETMLFNIDIEGFINKDKTAVLRVFAKMFYNHLGFYGENLKVALLLDILLQHGNLQVFSVEAKVVIEHLGKDPQDSGLVLIDKAFNINIEKHGFGFSTGSLIDEHEGSRIVLKLIPEPLCTGLTHDRLILQQIGEHLQKVRFTTAKEAGDPYTGIVGRLGKCFRLVIKEGNKMLFQLPGNDILF